MLFKVKLIWSLGILWPSVREELKSVKGYEISNFSSWMITKEPGMFLNDLESHLPLLWDKNILALTYDQHSVHWESCLALAFCPRMTCLTLLICIHAHICT